MLYIDQIIDQIKIVGLEPKFPKLKVNNHVGIVESRPSVYFDEL